jgi:hypothetical protein
LVSETGSDKAYLLISTDLHERPLWRPAFL